MQHLIVVLTILYAIGLVDTFSGKMLDGVKSIFAFHELTGFRYWAHLFVLVVVFTPLHILNGLLLCIEFVLKTINAATR